MERTDILQIPEWREIEWLRHGFSTRRGGVSSAYGAKSLNLGWTKEDDPASVTENRRLLRERIEGTAQPTMKLVTVRQVHGNHVQVIEGEEALGGGLETSDGKAVLEGDGLVTDAPGVLLGAGTADCVPVLVVDPVQRAVGAFHAGWRGTVARIVEHGVETMCRKYGSRPQDLLGAIGPSIGVCCYTVGEEVRERFTSEFSYGADLFRTVQGRSEMPILQVDLWKANWKQLRDAGLMAERITTVGECTACTRDESGEPKYFSHRAQAGNTGRMLNVVGIAKGDSSF